MQKIELLKQKISIKKGQNDETLRVMTVLKHKEITEYRAQKQHEFEEYKNKLLADLNNILLEERKDFETKFSEKFSQLSNNIKNKI